MRTLPPRFLALLLLSALPGVLRADEGLWLFSAPPRAQLKARYQFEATDAWLDHVMKSSVKFGTASGSFVSPDGLIVTNHHVARSTIQKLSTAQNDYVRDGFYARTREAELKCPDLAVSVLQSMEDVTARVNAAVPPGATAEAAALARRKAMNEIEQESQAKTGLQSLVVTLYQGGQHHLYRYKRYTDVRLVFAPEFAVAHFGGDVDNFEYPRYSLDVAFFRAYENGAPAHPSDYLKWSATGARDGDLVFISGHPGTTDRLLTVAELETRRDVIQPLTAERLFQNEVTLLSWGARSDENARRANALLLGVQNSRKRSDGFIAGLQDPALLAAKGREEAEFKQKLAARDGGTAALAAYDTIAAATRRLAAAYERAQFLEAAYAFDCQSFTLARDLLRAGDERPKPNGERLRAYADARLPAFELALFSPAPIYEDLETVRLASALSRFSSHLGDTDPTVRAVLAGRSPRARAAELIAGTKVRDVAFRRQLYAGGAAAVQAAHDPMIEVARLVDAEARKLYELTETEGEKIRTAHAAIALQRFALYGASEYPDATGTLRLTYGVVRGYTEEDGRTVPALTAASGLFARNAEHRDREPFHLPARWLASGRAEALGDTPYNFVSTCDTHGGNSGSPTINRAGELVGLLFDGNIQSLSGGMVYDDTRSRSVSVHSAAILAALEKVFDAAPLVAELRPRTAAD